MDNFDFSKLSDEQLNTFEKVALEAQSQKLDPSLATSIAHIESGFNPSAKSKAGAIGTMQLMPTTAKDLNVDPMDPAQNIKGGISYYKQQLDKYKDPYVAAIAYNAGPGVADKYLKTKDLSVLPDETLDYLEKLGNLYKEPKQIDKTQTQGPYGLRPDGTPKGKGFLGEIKTPDGNIMTEFSVGVPINGKEMDIPTLVPTLTKDEIKTISNLKQGEPIPQPIIDKAIAHAKERISEGKPVFATNNETEKSNVVKDFFTKPTEPQEVSGKRILASTAIGAGTGAVLGFGLPGAILGGLEGFTSGVAGEISRKAGAPEAVTLGSELLASGIPGVAKKIATSDAVKYFMTYGKRTIASKIPEVSPEARAFIKAKETQFGKDVVEGMSDITATEATQEALAKQVKDQMGIQVMPGEKVSNVVREKLYEDMGKAGVPAFVKSPAAYKDMQNRLNALVQRGRLTTDQAKTIDQIFKNQLSRDPLISKTAGSDIVNLIQHGGIAKTVYKEGVPTKEITTLIGKEDIAALREPFDNYLEKSIGSKAYSNLKGIEQQEFIASARDSIPTIIKGFSKEGSKAYTSALNNIAKSPEGQQDFLKAVNAHLGSVDKAANVVREWNKIKVGIKNTNALTPQQISVLDKKIAEIPALISKEKKNMLVKNIIRKGITSFSGDVMAGIGVGEE